MWDGLEIFSKVVEECWQEIITESLVLFGEFITAKAGQDDGKIAIIALGAEGISELILLNMYWTNWKELLAMGLANIILGLISLRIDIAEAFVNALTGIVTMETMAALTLIRQGTAVFGQIQAGTRTWVDMVGIGIFLVFGAIALGRGLVVMTYG
jgi:hypothetical protein